MPMCKHFACTRALSARTCTRSELICSTSLAMPDEVEAGRGCTMFRPRHPVRASRLRRFARHARNHSFASVRAAALGTPASVRSVSVHPLPDGERASERGEPLPLVAFEDAEQRRASRGPRASTVRSTWRAAGAIVRVSTPAGFTEQRKAARRAVFVGAPFFAYFLWQDKESKRPRGREAGGGTRQRKPARSAPLRFNQLAQHAK
jgi:hypothetical protein